MDDSTRMYNLKRKMAAAAWSALSEEDQLWVIERYEETRTLRPKDLIELGLDTVFDN